MQTSNKTPAEDLYRKLATTSVATHPGAVNRGTGTFSQESVDEDRISDRQAGFPAR